MAATEDALEGVLLGERWRLGPVLGQGGMATVWLAHDERLNRPVAVKVLAAPLATDPAFCERLVREAQVAARLSHPNLVSVFDFSSGPPRPYVVLEYVPGGTLADRLRAGRPVDAETLIRELLDALGTVHAAGIVHRDIKPANVLIDPAGRARLTDFGIARPSDAGDLTATGLVIGTLRYIAPEVLEGSPSTPRSDLYSLGVLLRETLRDSGPPHLRRLANALTAEDPMDRPRGAAEAMSLLSAPSPRPVAPALKRLQPTLQRTDGHVRISFSRQSAVACALTALAILFVVALLAGGDNAKSPPALETPVRSAPFASQLRALSVDVARARRPRTPGG